MVTIFAVLFDKQVTSEKIGLCTKSKLWHQAFVKYELNFNQCILKFSRGTEHLFLQGGSLRWSVYFPFFFGQTCDQCKIAHSLEVSLGIRRLSNMN